MYYRFIALLICFCLHASDSAAQETRDWAGFGIEANFSGGKVLKHTKKFVAPVPDLSKSYELHFTQQTFGRKAWHQRRNFPVVGFGCTLTDYGIDSIYGKAIGIYPTLQIPLIRSGHFEWTLRVGFGASFVTRHYARGQDWDTLNNAIGSSLNNYTIFNTDLRYRMNEHLDLQLGGNFSHISNGAFKQPNLGINMYGAHIGLRYFPVTSNPQKIYRNNVSLKNRWQGNVRLGMAFNESGTTDGPLYSTYLVSAFASKRWLSKNKMVAGLDYSYHNKVYAFLRNNEIFPGEESRHSWKSSVFIGNEFMFGRVGAYLQLGYYLKQAYLQLDPYYQKIGGNFYIIQHEKGILKEMCLSILLKTHKAQAELVDFGVGVGF